MNLWILSHLVGSPGNRLVESAAKRAGHEVRLVHPDALSLRLGGPVAPPGAANARSIVHGQGAGELPDLVFTRIGSSAPAGALDPLRQLERAGVRCVNASCALERSRDKVRSFQELAGHGVPLPATAVVGRAADLEPLLAELGPPPWIVKLPVSTKGMGVAVVDSLASLRSVLDLLRGLDQRVIVQAFVREARGADLRVLVVGGRPRAAMRRQAQGDEVRSNLALGGKADAIALTPELAQVAEQAAAALGLEVAGVDLLPSDQGPLVIEVNGAPGLEGLEAATQRDLASEVVAFLEQRLAGG